MTDVACGRTSSWLLPSFQINDYRMTRGYASEDHCHEWPSLAIGLAGELGIDFGGSGHCLRPGTALVIPRGTRHTERVAGKGVRALLVIPSATRLRSLTPLDAPTNVAAFPLDPTGDGFFGRRRHFEGSALAEATRRLKRELATPEVAGCLALEARLLEIIVALSRPETPSASTAPRWLRRVRRELELHFLDAPEQAELAKLAGVSREHLARCFRATYGCTLGEYLRVRRLSHSARRLRESKQPIAEIAMECGFADQSHLTRLFRNHYGVTPAVYRRRH